MQTDIGQLRARERLVHWWDSGKIPHAILLKGKQGWGNLALVRDFIQYIFCTQKQGSNACGQCDNCKKNQKLAHPDVHFTFPAISPKSGVKAMSHYFLPQFREFTQQFPYGTSWDWLQFIQSENRQGNISAEECRQIIDQLNLTAYEGGWKIQVVWMPEYLRENGNILLKLIEEPPAKTLLILVAEQTEMILPTILSRVQLVHLQPLDATFIAEKLAVLYPESNVQTRLQVAQWAQGDMNIAQKMLEAGVNNYLDMVKDWFNGIFGNNQFNLIHEFVEEAHHLGREHIKAILTYAQQLIGHLVRLKYQSGVLDQLVKEEADFLNRFQKLPVDVDQLLAMQNAIAEVVYFIERNVHTKTQLMALSIRVQAIYRKTPILPETL